MYMLHRKTSIPTLILAFLYFQLFQHCKTASEALSVPEFSLSSDTISEGDTLFCVNTSKNAKSFAWKIDGTPLESREESPFFILENAGKYKLELTTLNGEGVGNKAVKEFVVLPDTVFRLSNNSVKKWIIKSIVYGGNEMVTENCQKDDEFTVFRAAKDTCTMTEGAVTCPAGTYIFELPASSEWRYNQKKGAFEFALSAFGSPINLSFSITELTHTIMRGKDAINDVSIKLETP